LTRTLSDRAEGPPSATCDVVGRLTSHGVNVKGYFILGFPGEITEEINSTVALIRDL
jgi:radical SAM superfamily enzyme YgiQ (UPF0313 family)